MPLSPSTSAVAGAVRLTLMLGRALVEPSLSRWIYCGRRNTPCASAPIEIGFQHQLGDLGGVACRHAGLDHRILDEAGDGRGRRARGFRLHVHFGIPARNFSKLPLQDRRLVGIGNLQAAHVLHAIHHAHVVGIVAAEHDMVGADQADHGLERLARMQDGVVEETAGDVLRLRRHVLLRFAAAPPSRAPSAPPGTA